MMKRLEKKVIQRRISDLEGWHYAENAIHKSIRFKDFTEAFAAMTKIAEHAERLEHHPEWTNIYNALSISLSTHDADGVTEKDFEMAKAIEESLKQ